MLTRFLYKKITIFDSNQNIHQMKQISIVSICILITTFSAFAKKIVSPSISVYPKETAVEIGPMHCDKPMIEWYSDSIPFEMIDHYEVYQLDKTWKKIAQIKKDTLHYIIKNKFVSGSKYSFKITYVLKNKDIYESLPKEYEHLTNPVEPVTKVDQDFKIIEGVKYFHVTWELPKGYNETSDEFIVMFDSDLSPDKFAMYQNSLNKSKNEEYLEVYEHSKGKKLSYYIISRRNFIYAPPSPKFSFIVE